MTRKRHWPAVSAICISASLLAHPSLAQEIKFWTLAFASESANDAFNAMAKAFEAQNPGVKIVVETRGVDEHKTALRLAASSKQGPDIYFSWTGLGASGEYVKAGLSEPLDRYYAQYGWEKVFSPAALTLAIKDQSGGVHGVPFTVNGYGLYYNLDLFRQAGIQGEPKTYDELIAANDKLVAAGIAPITFGGAANWHLMRLLDVILEKKCSAATHDALIALTADWSKETCVTASFEELKVWNDKYILQPYMGIGQEQSFNLFVAGKAAMMLEGDWLVGQLDQNGVLDKYGVFPFPTDTERLYGLGQYYYVSAYSPHKDIDAKFLDFINNLENSQAYLGNAGILSVNRNVKTDYARPIEKEWVGIFGMYKNMFINADDALPLIATNEYWRVMNSVADGTMQPADAGAQMQKFIDANRG